MPSRLYRLGTELPRAQTSYELRDGTCVPRSDDAPNDRYFTLGDELDRDELVHITRTSVPTGDRLAALVDTSDDGLQLPTSLFDTEQQHECQLVAREGGTLACELGGVTSSTTFADRDCTIPASIVNASTAPPDLTRRHHGVECDTFHPLTELLLVDTSYTQSGPLCIETPLSVGDRVFALGSPVDVATAHRVRLDDARRLQGIEIGDSHFPDLFLFDTELQQECAPAPVGTDVRCVPTHQRSRAVFSDSTCETAALTVEIAPLCGVRRPVLAQENNGTLHPVLDPVETVYELSTAKSCATAIHSFDTGVFHLVGEPLEPSSFVRATR